MKSYQLTIPSNIYAGKDSIDNLVDIIAKENVNSILVFKFSLDKSYLSKGLSIF